MADLSWKFAEAVEKIIRRIEAGAAWEPQPESAGHLRRWLLDNLKTIAIGLRKEAALASPGVPSPVGIEPIRKRLARGQYRTLPHETTEGDIAYLLSLVASPGVPAGHCQRCNLNPAAVCIGCHESATLSGNNEIRRSGSLESASRRVDEERRRWYAAFAWAGLDLEGLAPETAADNIRAVVVAKQQSAAPSAGPKE